MSRSARRLELQDETAPAPTGPDGAKPTATMVLTGLVRTSHGYAVAIEEIGADGQRLSLRLGRSQAIKNFVAQEHKRVLVAAAQKA